MRGVLVVFAVVFAVGCGGGDGTGGAGGGSGGTGGGGGNSTSCSATNCAGCCLNGACQPGNTTPGCGKNGAACVACSTDGSKICRADQTCGVDPESTWKVQPVSATISTTNQGADWDFGAGAPDPFCDVWCPSTSATSSRTPTAADTFAPTWSTGGCTAKAKELLASGFAVDAWDEDVSSNDSISGKGTIQVTEAELLAGQITGIGNQSTLTNLKVTLTKQ